MDFGADESRSSTHPPFGSALQWLAGLLNQVGGGGGPLGSLQFVHRARARPSPLSALGAEPPITRHAPRRIAPALPSRGRRGADSCAADRAAPTSSPASQVVDVSPRGRLNWPATCLAFVVWRLPGIRLASRNGKHDLEDTTRPLKTSRSTMPVGPPATCSRHTWSCKRRCSRARAPTRTREHLP